MKNNAGVTRIVTYNCRKMAICCFLLLCIKVSWRHLANLKQMLRICALLALVPCASNLFENCCDVVARYVVDSNCCKIPEILRRALCHCQQ